MAFWRDTMRGLSRDTSTPVGQAVLAWGSSRTRDRIRSPDRPPSLPRRNVHGAVCAEGRAVLVAPRLPARMVLAGCMDELGVVAKPPDEVGRAADAEHGTFPRVGQHGAARRPGMYAPPSIFRSAPSGCRPAGRIRLTRASRGERRRSVGGSPSSPPVPHNA